MNIKKIYKNQKGQGLIEALIALVIIGVVMVGITLVTVKSLKIARKNEVQDVATQAMVEAMDYLKAPGDITAFSSINPVPDNTLRSNPIFAQQGGFFRLNDNATEGYKLISVTQATNSFITPADCTVDSVYAMKSLQDSDSRKNYTVCIQVYIYPRTTSGYDIYVIGVWQAPDEMKLNKIKGFRSNEVRVISDPNYIYTPPGCSNSCITLWEQINKNL